MHTVVDVIDPDEPPKQASPVEDGTVSASPPSGSLLSEEESVSSHLTKHNTQQDSHPGVTTPSRLLWIGNVSAEVSEALLMQLFGKYGTVENVSAYPTRSYAFIEFKELGDAQAAKEGLQGKLVKGQSLRIEFARPAKPSRHLWIWGVSESLTKEQLEEEFRKFGSLEDFKLLRDRNAALAEFKNVQDASAAIKGLNKKCIHGEELRVDFLRSQPGKRGNVGHDVSSQMILEEKANKEGEPSETLWIGFPPPSKVDEEGLRRAFILFGEVERITTFPDRSYCFVQFRNVDEATRAKEGLQGRLLNDPRILIRFSSNEGVPKRISKSEGQFFSPIPQRGSLVHMDLVTARTTHSPIEWPTSPNMMHLTNIQSLFQQGQVRQSGRGGGFIGNVADVRSASVSSNELHANNRFSSLGGWSYLIEEQAATREHKRAKVGLPNYVLGGGLSSDNNSLATSVIARQSVPLSELTKVYWKGAIAKAGNIICNVQCFPIGKGIEAPLPNIVNCIARTSLEMLAQHFDQSADCRVLCFIPDGDEENQSYYNFLFYLRDKCRSGVANLEDGTTLFLVPPSDFATQLLKLYDNYLFGLVMYPRKIYTPKSTVCNEHAYQAHQSPLNVATAADLAVWLKKASSGRHSNQAENITDMVASLTSILTSQRNIIPDDHGFSVGGVPSDLTAGAPPSDLTAGAPPREADTENRAHINSSTQNQLNYLRKLLSSSLSTEQEPKIANFQSSTDNSSFALQVLARQMLLSQKASEPSINVGAIHQSSDPSEESRNRFQATLELAAALLQRMQSVSGSQGAS